MPKKKVKKTKKKTDKKKKKIKKQEKEKKERSKKKIVIYLSILLIIILLIISGIIKLNFIIDEEIIITIEPQYTSKNLEYGETQEIEFKAELQNHWLCSAACEYEIISLDDKETLESGEVEISGIEINTFSSEIKVNKFGYGQEIYQFKIICSNQLEGLCPTTNKSFTRRAIHTINYEPTTEQKTKSNELKEKLEEANKKIAITKENAQKVEQILSNYTKESPHFEKKLEKINQNITEINKLLEEITKTYVNQTYPEMQFFTNEKINLVEEESSKFYEEIIRAKNNTEQIIDILKQIELKINTINKIYTLNETWAKKTTSFLNNIIADTRIFGLIENSEDSVNKTKEIEKEFEATQEFFISSFQKNRENYVDYALAKDMLCLQNNMSCLSLNETKITNTLNNTNMQELIKYSEDDCSEIKMLLDEINSITFSVYTQNATQQLLKYELLNLDSTIKNRINELKKIFDNNSSTTNLDLSKLVEINNKCESQNKIKLIESVPQKEIVEEQKIKIEPAEIPSIGEKCCAYGKCYECNADKTPLILIHGHSFSGRSNAYTSTEMFTKFENRLEQEELFVITGILNPQTDFVYGDLGKTILPTVFKPTYYVDYYSTIPGLIITESKNNNIDSYAIRLKEILDYVKEITDSNRVDVVAHSMGGLVVRRYIQIFDQDSINKFIMVGTPNKGIDSQGTTFCKLFGESAECEDMSSNSLFISKLNTQKPLSNTYIIIGKGCEMPDKSDGDGIVSVKSAEMQEAEIIYVQGECKGLSYLHNELLNTNKYPEVYNEIINILEENQMESTKEVKS